jgi:beta-galactosidase GanA
MKADVAILYSSSTDIWSIGSPDSSGRNFAYGFDRMHTWLALTHAQTPVDILSERDIEDGVLDGYKVCYFSGPNLTQKAAGKLKIWLDNGGTLVLTAGAGTKDEYNQPLTTLEDVLPVTRASMEVPQRFISSGRNIDTLLAKDNVFVGNASLEVLSVKQKQTPEAGASVLGTFNDGSAAIVKGSVGKGTVYSYGFLPSLSYIKEALVQRKAVENKVQNPQLPAANLVVSDEELIGRSYNPWKYPEAVRDVITMPLQEPYVERPLKCSVPLVDAVLMKSSGGLVIPLANYTLQPLEEVKLEVRVAKQIERIESVHHGQLTFKSTGSTIEFFLPLQETDIIKIYFAQN